ncbi:MAG: TetR/AcrR family transcriptional regulator [Sphingomicrobium sp.]
MESIGSGNPVQRRPGGRTAKTTARVNAAVIALLAEEGLESCTMPNVAVRAGVERSTLYRRYPDRWAMIIDAIAEKAEELVTSSNQGGFVLDLATVLRKLAALLETPIGPALMMVAAAIRASGSPDYAQRFWGARVQQLQPMFDAAVDRGEIRSDVDVEEAFALAAGPIYFRTFISRKPVDAAFIATIVASVQKRYSAGRGPENDEFPA